MLPELTDEWVTEASEFETVDELRADIRKRVETMQRFQAQRALRDKVLDAAADLVPIEAPPTLDRRGDTPPGGRPCAPSVTSGCEPRAVPRDDGPGAAGVHRRDQGRCGPGRPRRSRAARGRRPRGRHCERRRGRRSRSNNSPCARSRSPQRCAASSNGVGRWRRYALMLPVERRSSSWSSTQLWSTRAATRST